MKFLPTITLILCIAIFSGCDILLLGETAEVGIGAAAAEEGLMSLGDLRGLAPRYGISETGLGEGRLLVTDQVAAEGLYDDLVIDRLSGENPKLYIENNSKPVGEILTKEGEIRFQNGRVARIEHDIFSVAGEEVNLRSTPSSVSNENIIATVRHGHMVIKMNEVADGWYQVKVMKNHIVTPGFIKGVLLVPVIVDSTRNDRYSFQQVSQGAIPFPTPSKIKRDLVGQTMTNWTFLSEEEIKSMEINNTMLNGDENYYVNVTLLLEEHTSGKQYIAHCLVRYHHINYQWALVNVSQDGFQMKDYPRLSVIPKNFNVPSSVSSPSRQIGPTGYANPYTKNQNPPLLTEDILKNDLVGHRTPGFRFISTNEIEQIAILSSTFLDNGDYCVTVALDLEDIVSQLRYHTETIMKYRREGSLWKLFDIVHTKFNEKSPYDKRIKVDNQKSDSGQQTHFCPIKN